MSCTTPTDKNDSHSLALLADLTLYRDIGLDDDGRAHFYAPPENVILVTATDRRGKGVHEEDIVETIPVGEKTLAQYCRYVRDDTETCWTETDITGWQ